MIPCMGGWCSSRGKCANYYATGREPVERLCGEEEELDKIERVRNDGRGMECDAQHGSGKVPVFRVAWERERRGGLCGFV